MESFSKGTEKDLCLSCAFYKKEDDRCWYGQAASVMHWNNCTLHLKKNSCMFCSKRRGFICPEKGKVLDYDSEQCEKVLFIKSMKEFRR